MNSAFDWDIDFDAWAHLAHTDPHNFEKQRSDLLNEVILHIPLEKQQRIRCLQWRIDRVRETSGTPLAACIRISNMMWDSVMGKGGLRDSLHLLSQAESSAQLPMRPRATVLSFPRSPSLN